MSEGMRYVRSLDRCSLTKATHASFMSNTYLPRVTPPPLSS